MEIRHYQKMRNVDRLMGTPKNRRYDLMQHSYMVSMLFCHFAKLESVPYDKVVLECILHHDIVEVLTGDLIHPVKNFSKVTKDCWEQIEEEILNCNPEFQPYSDHEMRNTMTTTQFALFKACDLLDLYIFCKEEQALGNSTEGISYVISNIGNLLPKQFESVNKYISNYE